MIQAKKSRYLRKNVTSILKSYGVLIGLVLIIIIASIVESTFLTANNLLNILRQASVIGIVSLGVTYVMMLGRLDLSVGSIVSLCSVVAVGIMNAYGKSANSSMTALFVILIVAVVGFLIGTLNGTIIAVLNGRLGESFIITYGMLIVVGSLALLYSRGQFTAGTYASVLYHKLGTGFSPIIIFLVIAVVMQFILARTRFGKKISFMGANVDCARMSGIKVRLLQIITYGICGVCAGIASVIVTSRVYSASPLQGTGYELDAIAAVVVGGTSMTGGSGSIINTILGVLVLSVLGNALNVIGVGANAQLLVRGAIIIIAVGLDIWNKIANERGQHA